MSGTMPDICYEWYKLSGNSKPFNASAHLDIHPAYLMSGPRPDTDYECFKSCAHRIVQHTYNMSGPRPDTDREYFKLLVKLIIRFAYFMSGPRPDTSYEHAQACIFVYPVYIKHVGSLA